VFAVTRLARRFGRVHAALSDTADQVAEKYPPKPGSGIPSNVVVEFRHSDGFAVARRVSRADLVFLDPPFHPDADADWKALAAVCQALAERGLAFVAWYPFYWPAKPQQLVDTTKCSAWEVSWTRSGCKPSQDLKGCGMLVSNSVAPVFREIETKLRRISACLGWEVLVRQPTAI
jgi:23S rRNA A2030 N6-methylase RlmJ